MPEAGVAVRMAPSAPQPVVPVDCSQRLPICGAVCCKLDFALTLDEVEAGLTKWDLGRPYFIRHGPDGSCVHLDRATKGCGVYDTFAPAPVADIAAPRIGAFGKTSTRWSSTTSGYPRISTKGTDWWLSVGFCVLSRRSGPPGGESSRESSRSPGRLSESEESHGRRYRAGATLYPAVSISISRASN